eukprot:Blabericola_migrator_1__8611@NODE_450_length_8372_cov_59_228898_g352_i0_p3_GENE_NODE_450_length_8372_cov_59_228898_g352_i0NODE_450_length_8372_cov_59_228898_g352_i0_p3_ORF_typecomplete_len327_score28_13RD3/PF14473_6/0_025Dsh_C/PF12316_8/1_2e02Dsh_C/PF12316_8/3_5_NODE_450_length_8372_cov_59_228898_g352_i05131493
MRFKAHLIFCFLIWMLETGALTPPLELDVSENVAASADDATDSIAPLPEPEEKFAELEMDEDRAQEFYNQWYNNFGPWIDPYNAYGYPPYGPWMSPRPPKNAPWTYPYPWQPGWPVKTRPPSTSTTTHTSSTSPSAGSSTSTTSTTRGGGSGSSEELIQLLLRIMKLLLQSQESEGVYPTSAADNLSPQSLQDLEDAIMRVQPEQLGTLTSLFPDISTFFGTSSSDSSLDPTTIGSTFSNLFLAAGQLLTTPVVPWWAQLLAVADEARWRALEDFERRGNDPWPFARIFGSPFTRTIQALNNGRSILPPPLARAVGNTLPQVPIIP